MDVVIAVVPRERFSFGLKSIMNIHNSTDVSIPIVYLATGYESPELFEYIKLIKKERKIKILNDCGFKTPNQYRNIALSQVDSKYIVFIDNDTLVRTDWINNLVHCAEETGAGIVGPIYFEDDFKYQKIHMAGGRYKIVEKEGERQFNNVHLYAGKKFDNVKSDIKRSKVDYIECHCFLARTDFFKEFGKMDEQLYSINEHLDIAMIAEREGIATYIEPTAQVTYIPASPYEINDSFFYYLRWCETWNYKSTKYFNNKWNVNFYDVENKWGRLHRGFLNGGRVPHGPFVSIPTTLNESQHCLLMLSTFLSLDVYTFSLFEVCNKMELPISEKTVEAPDIANEIFELVKSTDKNGNRIEIRPHSPERFYSSSKDLKFINLRGVKRAHVEKLISESFLVTKIENNFYEIWFCLESFEGEKIEKLKKLLNSSSDIKIEEKGSVSGTGSKCESKIEMHSFYFGHISSIEKIANLFI